MNRLRAVESKLRAAVGGSEGLQTRCYVDTGPLVERVYAKYAGVGWIGKNTCILNQKMGSWLFLGVILTSLELEPDLPAPDRCGTCTRCIDACPTDALVAPYQLDSNRCISYLTIEKRGAIAEDMRPAWGTRFLAATSARMFVPGTAKLRRPTRRNFSRGKGWSIPRWNGWPEMTAEEFREKFRGSAVRRAKRSGLRRNAVIAMGNSGDRRFGPLLEKLKTDEDEVVAESAEWAAKRLAAGALIRDRAGAPDVRRTAGRGSILCVRNSSSPVRTCLVFAFPRDVFPKPCSSQSPVRFGRVARNPEPKWIRIKLCSLLRPHRCGRKERPRKSLRLEQMRDIFSQLFLKAKLQLPEPLDVIALQIGRGVHPGGAAAAGPTHFRAGIFLHGDDRNYIVLDLAAEDSWRAVSR